ncbi:MAG: AMP-binding protein [Proteobacteria bacterium]|nr:AMP-binding protein [Pseudomonadota bacterium]
MAFELQTPPARIDYFKRSGLWPNRRVTDCFDAAVAAHPDRAAIIGYDSQAAARVSLTYAELGRIVDRVALGLIEFGIKPGDVVSVQLPNYWQFAVLHLACVRIGAVTNPLMPIFRRRELSFMLPFAEAKAVFVPRRYRGFDYPAMIDALRGDAPDLRHVFVIDGPDPAAFLALFPDSGRDRDAEYAARRPDPDDVSLLLYTSGTTGQPKGVMHNQNTLIGNLVKFVERIELGPDDIILMPSPLAHLTGFGYGLVMPIFLGATAVLMDVWDPAKAARIIQDERATFCMASTPFLADLANAPAVDECDVASLRIFLTAGAPIPRVLVERAQTRLGATVIACWGMTENGAAAMTRPSDPPDKIFESDGGALDGMEVRVVDDNDNTVPVDVEGRLQVRGAFNFVGYLKRPELFATDADGWFDTGDNARMRPDGYIRISGRSKDVIIRGGENIPVVEVEELLYRHPAVQDAAIVAMPDERLGERACAFVTLKPEAKGLSFQEMVAYLSEKQMARNYFPERLEVIDAMPRTASGKIQKFQLRERLEQGVKA